MVIRITAEIRRTARGIGMEEIERRLRRMAREKNSVGVGFPAGVGPDLVMRAAWSEFGTVNQPARPFMTNALHDNKRKYLRLLGRAAEEALLRGTSLETGLNLVGIEAVGDIQDTIASSVPPPNAPATVARKGSSTTLIDSGEMRQRTAHEIRRHRFGQA